MLLLETLMRSQECYRKRIEAFSKNADAPQTSNLSFIHRAIVSRDTKALSEFLRGDPTLAVMEDELEIPSIIYALCSRRHELLEPFLNNGFSIDQIVPTFNVCLLHAAVLLEDVDLVRFLIERGANVNVRDNYSFTSLHYAAKTNSVVMLQLLCAQPTINLGAADFRGAETALALAKRMRHRDSITYLQKAKTDLTKALWDTIKFNDKETFFKLLGRGADLALKDLDLENPALTSARDVTILHYANLYSNKEIIEGITEHYPALPTVLDSMNRLPSAYASLGKKNAEDNNITNQRLVRSI